MRNAPVLFVLFTIFGCSNPTGVERIAPIDGHVIFQVHETHPYGSESDPVPTLKLVTERDYGCYNYSIRTDVTNDGETIGVRLLGIKVPEMCLTAIGPATFQTGLTLRNGRYRLRFSVGQVVDEYVVNVADSSISVREFSKGRIMTPAADVFWRFPPRTFAYICGTTPETSWICEDLVDTLFAHVDLEEFRFPEGGVIPYPEASYGHYHDTPARYFRYHEEADFDRVGEIFDRVSPIMITPYRGVSVSMVNWRNRRFAHAFNQ